MENTENRREHNNLYYIFAADKQKHPMPPEMAEEIRKNILRNLLQKSNHLNNEGSSIN